MFQLTDSLLRGVMHHRAQFPLELCHPPVFEPKNLSLAFPTSESDTTSVSSTTPSEASTVSTPVLRERMSLSFITNPDPVVDTQHTLNLPQAGVICSKKNCYRTANSLFGAFYAPYMLPVKRRSRTAQLLGHGHRLGPDSHWLP
ncbi:hypothetical protein PC123_g2784 [Phytophthora cactorum]|nr:hypothetical protein PC123_g2784 [Phytophthora cactorum]